MYYIICENRLGIKYAYPYTREEIVYRRLSGRQIVKKTYYAFTKDRKRAKIFTKKQAEDLLLSIELRNVTQCRVKMKKVELKLRK